MESGPTPLLNTQTKRIFGAWRLLVRSVGRAGSFAAFSAGRAGGGGRARQGAGAGAWRTALADPTATFRRRAAVPSHISILRKSGM